VDLPQLRCPQRKPRPQLPRHPMEHACAPAHHNPPGERVYPSRARTQRPPCSRARSRPAPCVRPISYTSCPQSNRAGEISHCQEELSRLALDAVAPLTAPQPVDPACTGQVPARHLHLRRTTSLPAFLRLAYPLVQPPLGSFLMRLDSTARAETCTARGVVLSVKRSSQHRVLAEGEQAVAGLRADRDERRAAGTAMSCRSRSTCPGRLSKFGAYPAPCIGVSGVRLTVPPPPHPTRSYLLHRVVPHPFAERVDVFCFGKMRTITSRWSSGVAGVE